MPQRAGFFDETYYISNIGDGRGGLGRRVGACSERCAAYRFGFAASRILSLAGCNLHDLRIFLFVDGDGDSTCWIKNRSLAGGCGVDVYVFVDCVAFRSGILPVCVGIGDSAESCCGLALRIERTRAA